MGEILKDIMNVYIYIYVWVRLELKLEDKKFI